MQFSWNICMQSGIRAAHNPTPYCSKHTLHVSPNFFTFPNFTYIKKRICDIIAFPPSHLSHTRGPITQSPLFLFLHLHKYGNYQPITCTTITFDQTVVIIDNPLTAINDTLDDVVLVTLRVWNSPLNLNLMCCNGTL